MVGQSEEYQKLVDEAIKLNEITVKKVKCKYIKNGIKYNAYIDWQTGVITDEDGVILRGGCRA